MKISRRIYQDITDHAVQGAPLETCNYQVGEAGYIIVSRQHKPNSLQSFKILDRQVQSDPVEII